MPFFLFASSVSWIWIERTSKELCFVPHALLCTTFRHVEKYSDYSAQTTARVLVDDMHLKVELHSIDGMLRWGMEMELKR